MAAAVGFPEVLVRRCSYILVRPPRARGLKVRDGGPLTLRLCCVRSPPDAILLPPRVACMCAFSQTQSSLADAERRRRTCPSCRSSSIIMVEYGKERRDQHRRAPAARRLRCPTRRWRGRGSRRESSCGSGGGFGGGSEPALARPSGSAEGTCARARLAEPVRGIGRPPMSDLGFCYVSTAFCSWRHVRVSAVCRERA